MALLDIINLKAHFPTQDGMVKAVDCVDLTLGERERLGLIGETGCGKTVLGMSIIRLLQPTTRIDGQILFRGKDLLKLSEEEMRRNRGKGDCHDTPEPNNISQPCFKDRRPDL